MFDQPSTIARHYVIHVAIILPPALLAGTILGAPILTTAIAVVAGILIDVDHILDYILNVPRDQWRIRSALRGDHLPNARHVYVFLHGYDLAVLLAAAAVLAGSSTIGVGLLVGMFAHIATDQLDYSGHPLRYVLLFRLLRRFPNDIFVHSQEAGKM